jgi:hypothetical protein
VKSWSRRRWLFVSGAALLAAGTALGIIYGRRGRIADVESLAGVQLGEDRDTVVARLGKPTHPGKEVWKSRPSLLGELLRPADLGAGDNADRFELLTWREDRVGVLLEQNQVRAIVVREPYWAETGRSVRIGDSEKRLKQRYDEPSAVDKEHYETDDGKGRKRTAWGVIYRYASLGLSAVVRDDRVTGLALYPPK